MSLLREPVLSQRLLRLNPFKTLNELTRRTLSVSEITEARSFQDPGELTKRTLSISEITEAQSVQDS